MTRVLIVIPLSVGLVALLWFGFGKDPSNVPNPLIDKAAPAFTLRSTSGRPVDLKSLRGRPVVLSFFASWCTSCKEQEQNLVSVYSQWRRRATFLGVIFGDTASAATAFTRSHGGNWPDLIDPGGNMALNYGITGVPGTFFINRNGIVTDYTVSLAEPALEQGLRSAMSPRT